jgi:hypothetical protein
LVAATSSFEGRLWFLDYADVIAILDKNVVNTFPAGTICPRAIEQDDIFTSGVVASSRFVSPLWAKAEIELAKRMKVIMRIEIVFITG